MHIYIYIVSQIKCRRITCKQLNRLTCVPDAITAKLCSATLSLSLKNRISLVSYRSWSATNNVELTEGKHITTSHKTSNRHNSKIRSNLESEKELGEQ